MSGRVGLSGTSGATFGPDGLKTVTKNGPSHTAHLVSHGPGRRTEPLAQDRGTRRLETGTHHLLTAYGDPQSLLKDTIKGVSISKSAVKLGTAAAAAIIAEERLKGIPLGKALKLLSGKLSTLGDVGNSIRGVISTGAFIGDVKQIQANPKLLKDPKFLLKLGYDVAGTAGGALTDVKFLNTYLTSKGTFVGGKLFKLMGKDGKLEGIAHVGEDGIKVVGKDGEVLQEVSGDFSKVKDLSELKELGVVTDATKAIPVSALGDFVGKAAPGLGVVFGGLGAAHDIMNISRQGFTVHNSLDLASNVLQTVGAVAVFLPPPIDAAGGAMMLASAGIQIAELGIKNMPKIEHFAATAVKDAGHLGSAAAKDVEKGAGTAAHAIGHAASSAWHAVSSWL